MLAKCLSCRRTVPGGYEFGQDVVELLRTCAVCGPTASVVSEHPSHFRSGLNSSSEEHAIPTGIIVELLDGCNIQCPTCIAGSTPLSANLRDPHRVRDVLLAAIKRDEAKAVYLSGGEPTIHPRLLEFIDVVDEMPVDRRVLITNGLRIAEDRSFRSALLKRLTGRWEVFLQFDSLSPDALRDLRGDDFSSVRIAAVDALNEYQVTTTLVAVAKRNVTLHDVPRVVEFGLAQEAVVGVQFQPIRDAGRVLNYDPKLNMCTSSDVMSALASWQPKIIFGAHPRSPLSISLAYAGRGRSGVRWHKDPAALMPSDFYLEPTRRPDGRFRISIVEYSDDTNWTSVRSMNSPLSVLQPDGSTSPVDDHFLPVVGQAAGL